MNNATLPNECFQMNCLAVSQVLIGHVNTSHCKANVVFVRSQQTFTFWRHCFPFDSFPHGVTQAHFLKNATKTLKRKK